MQRLNLEPDALALPPERKQNSDHDYKRIYPDTNPVRHYNLENKQETKEQAATRSEFQKQFLQLLELIKKWGDENNCTNPELIARINTFKTNIFDASYTGNQTSEYFSSIKQNLEMIWFALATDQKEISPAKKHEAFKKLCGSMDVCAPGLYTHIEDTLNFLSTDISLERWLAELRSNFIRLHAEKHVRAYGIPDGNSIHVYNAFLVYALNEGLAPLSNVSKITDPFTVSLTGIGAKQVAKFFKEFYHFYNAEEIVNCVCTNFFYHFNQNKPLEQKDGWTPATPEFLKKIGELANLIGLTEINFCDLTDDGKLLRFNATVFKKLFLKSCKENKKLLSAKLWQEISLSDYKLYCNAEKPTLSWFENSDQEIIDWNKLSSGKDPRALIASFLEKSLQDDWSLIIKCASKQLEKSLLTAEHLGKIGSLLPEKWMLDTFLQLLSKQTWKFFISNANYKSFFAPFLSDKEQLDTIKNNTFFCYFVGKNAIKYGQIELLNYLISDLQMPLEQHNDPVTGNNLYHYICSLEDHRFPVLFVIMEPLSKTKININATNKAGQTPLHLAIQNKSKRNTSYLLDQNADINAKNDQGTSPLMFAMATVDEMTLFDLFNPLFSLLIKFDTDLNLEDAAGQTVIDIALEKPWFLKKIKLLVDSNADIDHADKKGLTPLNKVILKNDLPALQKLLELKANYNKPDQEGNTPAHQAFRLQHMDCLKLLANFNADFNLQNHTGQSPLAIAIKNQDAAALSYMYGISKFMSNWNLAHVGAFIGNSEIIKAALTEKVDLNQQDDDNSYAPVHLAARNGHADIIRILAENKAYLSSTATKMHNNTPAHFAAKMDKPDVIHVLAEYKTDLNLTNSEGDTPIACAVEEDSAKAVSALIDCKVDMNVLDKDSCPLSFLAARVGSAEVIATLLEKRLDLNKQWDGATLAHVATKHDHDDVIKVLAEYKANLDAKDRNGLTPLHVAVNSHKLDLLVELIRQKASYDNLASQDNEGNTPFALALQKQNWRFVAFMLLHTKNEASLKPEHKKILVKQRNNLTKGFLKFCAWLNEKDRLEYVEQVLKSKNCLGIILNRPSYPIAHFFQKSYQQGLTEKMFRIVTECNYPLAEEKKKALEIKDNTPKIHRQKI